MADDASGDVSGDVSDKDLFLDFGNTGLKRSGGWILEEWHPKLQGARGVRVYREMSDNDAIVGALLFLIQNLIRQADWPVIPASEEKSAKEAAEFLESCIADMSHTWEDLIIEILSMLPYGWAYFETVYKLRKGKSKDSRFKSKFDDGKIGWRKIEIRGQETLWRWEFSTEDNGLLGMWQYGVTYDINSGHMRFIPIEKSLLFRTTTHKGNPEGRSILRNAWRSWHFEKRMQEIEGIGIERDLAGYPIFEAPIEILSSQANARQLAIRQLLEKTVQQIRRDEREGAVIPSELDPTTGKPTGYKLRLLSTGGRRQIVTDEVIKRYETRIAMSVLAEFLMLGTDKVGTHSLASSKTHVFSMAMGSLMDSIASVFNRFGIPRLMELNGFEVEDYPTIEHGDIESPPLDEIGSYVKDLSSAGIDLTDEATQRKLREMASLPSDMEDIEEGKKEEAAEADATKPDEGEPEPPEGADPESEEQ